MRSTRLQGCFLNQKLHRFVSTFFKTGQIIESYFELSKIYFKGKICAEKRLSVVNGSANPHAVFCLQGLLIFGHGTQIGESVMSFQQAIGLRQQLSVRITAIRRGADGAVEGVETTRGPIATKRIGVSAAGNTSVVMQMAGLDFPLESYPLQALVSEPVKPTFPCVVMSNTVHAYMSQSDKGELVIGAGTDQYVSYSQRGALHIIEHTLAAICEIFPIYRRMRMLRTWGGIVDVTPDRSPILGKTPVKGLYVNCGWGTGGFKATPGAGDLLAYTMAKDEPHRINAPFNLDRFRNGRLIDEAAAAAVAH